MLVNCRNLLGHTTGVQRYTKSIIDYWRKNKILFSEVYPNPQFSSGIKGHMWEQVSLTNLSNNSKDLLWSPCNTGPLFYSNQILTIHDTVSFDHPEWLNKKFALWYKFLQPKLAKKVKHIITISEFSKNKIIEHCNISEEKISVVYNGVDLISNFEINNSDNKFFSYNPYLLSVGSLEPRKNLLRLISAFIKYKNEVNSEIKLVIVGKKGTNRVFGDAGISNINNDDIIFTDHVTDAELQYLYKNALGFCYPSLYEGFGLPPLEAMQFSIPVLTSNSTAIKELCNERAILVDPLSVDDIAEGIFNLLNGGISQEIIDDNLQYVKDLSWHKCAEQTFQILSTYK